MISHALTLLVLAAEPSLSSRASLPVDRAVGAAMAPAALPGGTIAFWGLVGAPDVGAGYRQGFSSWELDAQLVFNYLTVSTIVEVGARVPVYRRSKLLVAPTFNVGLELNSGSTYYDRANFGAVSFRPRVGAVASYAFNDLVQGLVLVDVPWSIALNVLGSHFAPTVGAGAEVHLGGKVSVLALGQIGVDSLKGPLAVTQVRPAWAIRLGFGYRLF